MKRLFNRSLIIFILLLIWSQLGFGQCALEDFLSEISKSGVDKLFKESSKEYFRAWKIIYSERDAELALIRQKPENLMKIKNYIDEQAPDLRRLKDSFENARNDEHAQKWIDLKISQKDLDATNIDMTIDPAPWTKNHKAQRWKNYQASDEPKLEFNEWSNVYDGNIDKATSATESVRKYVTDNGLVDFLEEQYEHVVDVSVNVRGKTISSRRHDLYNEYLGEAVEVKDYRSQKVYLSEDIEREVRMDLQMLAQGKLEKMTWVFLEEGPSGPLLELLNTVLPNGKRIIIKTK